ncbi:MAG TPA: TIGR03118 family protein [Candidatus Acidoferrum sp.]|nr:TIGR03118 family protein [Candidatus Acidoferrum sp.]
MKITNAFKSLACMAVLTLLLPAAAQAQYTRMDLNSNQSGVAPHVNPQLINPWGLVQLGTSPIWLSDNGSGFSTLYTGTGLQLGLVVLIPGLSEAQGTPTGIVGNTGAATDFVFTNAANGQSGRAIFIFATLDGAIAAWNPGVGGADQAGHSLATIPMGFQPKPGATYTGLAIATNSQGQTFLYAADDGPNRQVDMFDSSFKLVQSFSDPAIPRIFTPYGIQEIDGPSGPQIWVTFTALNKSQGGFVDVFNTDGTLAQHFAVNGPLHSPWGIAKAPADFGPMSNAILISNNTSRGRVNAFDASGTFLGPLRDANGQAIEIDNLWGIAFGHDGGAANGGREATPHNFLFFTAGPNSYADGLFGVITPRAN